MRQLLTILITVSAIAIIAIPSYLIGFNLGRKHIAPEKENVLRINLENEILQRLEQMPANTQKQPEENIINGTIKNILNDGLLVERRASTYAEIIKEPTKEIRIKITPETKIYYQTLEPAEEVGKPAQMKQHFIGLTELIKGETLVAELYPEQTDRTAKIIIVNER